MVPAFAEEIEQPVQVTENAEETATEITGNQEITEAVNEIVAEEASSNEEAYESETSEEADDDIEEASPSDAKQADSGVFVREVTVEGVKVKVEAPEGTFPADAELSVTAVDEDTVDENIENVEEKIDEAVENARKKDKDLKNAKVLSSLKFDIKIVLPDGTELQPEGNKVKVAFTLAEKVGDCVDINVYHLKEVENTENAADTEASDVSLKAEKVEGTVKTVPAEETAEAAEGTTAVKAISEEVDEEGILADGPITNDVNDEVTEFEGETDGFSYYTVEFTYEELQYVLPGDSSIALSDILAQLKIEGTVADVEVSNPELFSADKDANGVWRVTALQAFSSTEKMTVTMDDGTKYEIVVTDDATGITTWEALQAALSGDDDGTITLGGNITAGTGNTTLTVSGTKTLDLNGYVINGTRNDGSSVGSVIKVGSGANLTLKDSSTGEPGKITGGTGYGVKSGSGGGVYVDGGEFTMTGGEICKNEVGSQGGGVYVNNGKFTMTGGSIKENDAGSYGGGIYVIGTVQLDLSGTGSICGNTATQYGGGVCFAGSGNFNMTGGSIIGNTATQNGGGVIISTGTFSMTGGSITGNTATKYGGGVYYGSGTMTLGGDAIITGNVKDGEIQNGNLTGGTTNNVYLPSKKYINIGDDAAEPTGGMHIGVTTQNSPEVQNSIQITTNGAAGDVQYFFADKDGEYVEYAEGQLYIAAIPSGSYKINIGSFEKGSVTSSSQIAEENDTVSLTVTPDDGCHLKEGTLKVTYNDGTIIIPEKDATDDTKYTFNMPAYSVTVTAEFEENPSPDPDPQPSKSGSTYTLYTGTWNNPVSNGKWVKNADGTWSYSTRYKFTETWACIADAGKSDSKTWYYFDRNGIMLTGWQKLYWNGAYRWFYFSKTKDANEGKCQLGGITPDGYALNPDGSWKEN